MMLKDLNTEIRVLSESQGAYLEMGDKVWSFARMFNDQAVIKWQRDPLLSVTKNYWTTSDHADFEYLYNKGTHYYYTYIRLRGDLETCRKAAIELISLLAREYRLN